jgi:imidazolonepropionase
MFAHGTTTVEAKTGHGLETAAELKLMARCSGCRRAADRDRGHLLGAHATAGTKDDARDTRSDLRRDAGASANGGGPRAGRCPLDVFVRTRLRSSNPPILTLSAELGFRSRSIADEFDNLGGASLAVELGAVSADHLVKTSASDIAALGASETVAVSLPCTPFGLAEGEYTPAKQIIEADGILALATDCNPGTAWNESMQFAIALACRFLGLTPAQAIAAATINAAYAIRRDGRVGSLEVGKQADLIVLEAPDHRHLGYRFGTNLVRHVVKNGKVYSVGRAYDEIN